MGRLAIALLLLQGSLFTALGTEITTTPSSEKGKNQKDASTSTSVHQYRLTNHTGDVCILMEMDAVLNISFEAKTREIQDLEEYVDDVQPKGFCDDNEAHLTIAWKAFELQWNFSKSPGGDRWYVSQVELKYDKSDALFENASSAEDVTLSTMRARGGMLFYTPIGKSYQSLSDYKLKLSSSNENVSDFATLLLHQFRLQPFMDKPTFDPATELSYYQIRNKNGEPCLFMELDAYVSVNWEVSPNETKEIDMLLQPSKMLTTGSCGKEETQITMTWKSFRLQWTFSKTRDWKKWFVKQVELQYDKNALEQQTNSTTGAALVSAKSSSEVLLFSAPAGEAYDCPSEDALDLSGPGTDSALLRLRHFRVQPFLAEAAFGPSYCPKITTSATLESSTTSSSSSDPVITNTATNSPSDPSYHTNVASASPSGSTLAPISPSRAATLNNAIDSPGTSADSTQPHSTFPSARPFRASTKPPALSNPVSFQISTRVSGMTSTAAPLPSLSPYAYQKMLPNAIKMPFYPPKKVFFSGVKLDSNDALSAMLWSWYTSGFYTGYYQALQQPKKL